MKSRKDLQPKLDAERDHGDYAVGSYVLAQFRHGPWIAARVEKAARKPAQSTQCRLRGDQLLSVSLKQGCPWLYIQNACMVSKHILS